jgi:serine/threonine-protein kinase
MKTRIYGSPVAANDCVRFDRLIAATGANTLSPPEEEELATHLASCESCREDAALLDSDVSVEVDLELESAAFSLLNPIQRAADVAPVVLAPGLLVADKYELDAEIGEGGMGVIWSATQRPTRRRVALKFLKILSDSPPDARHRFLREARVASAIRHPNVVDVLDLLEPPGFPPIIVMELLEGEPLQSRLARHGKLSLYAAARLLLPAISAIGTAHAAGVVHRDLKPENIFIARDFHGADLVKILDFGVAKLTSTIGLVPVTAHLTVKGTIVGTMSYMAPEQAMTEPNIDHRADIWSLGIILYQLLTGILPTEGATLMESMARTLSGVPSIERYAPELPESIRRLVGRMVAVSPADRPVDLREVFESLTPFAADVQSGTFGPASSVLVA